MEPNGTQWYPMVPMEETAAISGTLSENSFGVYEGKYQSLGIHEGLMERVLDLIPFRACVDLKMNMLFMAIGLHVELIMEHSSFDILDEGDILK